MACVVSADLGTGTTPRREHGRLKDVIERGRSSSKTPSLPGAQSPHRVFAEAIADEQPNNPCPGHCASIGNALTGSRIGGRDGPFALANPRESNRPNISSEVNEANGLSDQDASQLESLPIPIAPRPACEHAHERIGVDPVSAGSFRARAQQLFQIVMTRTGTPAPVGRRGC